MQPFFHLLVLSLSEIFHLQQLDTVAFVRCSSILPNCKMLLLWVSALSAIITGHTWDIWLTRGHTRKTSHKYRYELNLNPQSVGLQQNML